ncbi:MAG: hypothetical protein II828_08095 [Clostridia bacterium]|nr:hypothetical protein [Clostridia bacterium]
MNLSRGMIALSRCQAESTSIPYALCLTYFLAASAATVALIQWMRGGGDNPVWLMSAAAAGLTALYCRGTFVRELYNVTVHFLRTERLFTPVCAGRLKVFGWELSLAAFQCGVLLLTLAPAWLCLREGAAAYALGGDDETLLAHLVSAAFCLTVSGILTAWILTVRFSCAFYLLLSGRCDSPGTALTDSWRLTRKYGGELLTVCFLSHGQGAAIAILSRMNYADALMKAYESERKRQMESEWRVELVRDEKGEQRLELFPC